MKNQEILPVSIAIENKTAADFGGCFHLFDKLEFGGESPRTMRARCSAFRNCPNPLGIVTAEQFDKLEFGYIPKI